MFKYIEDLSYKIANKIGKDDSEEDIELYQYTVFMLISETFSVIGGFILAMIFDCIIPYIVINFVFAFLRKGAGGYHCPTFKSCFWVCNILFTICGCLSIYLMNYSKILFAIAFGLGIYIIPNCPKASKNSPSRGYKIDLKFRKLYINWLIVFLILDYICLSTKFLIISNAISFTIILVVFFVSNVGINLIQKILDLFN